MQRVTGLELQDPLATLFRKMPAEFINRAEIKVGATPVAVAADTNVTIQTDPAESYRQLAEELAVHQHYLSELAQRYNWWQAPNVALLFPARLVAQVMNLGTFADITQLAHKLGDDCLRRVLANAEAGQLNPRSWHYWHYRLNNVKAGQVPPMPRRRIA